MDILRKQGYIKAHGLDLSFNNEGLFRQDDEVEDVRLDDRPIHTAPVYTNAESKDEPIE